MAPVSESLDLDDLLAYPVRCAVSIQAVTCWLGGLLRSHDEALAQGARLILQLFPRMLWPEPVNLLVVCSHFSHFLCFLYGILAW